MENNWVQITEYLPPEDAMYLVYVSSLQYIKLAWYNPVTASWSLIDTFLIDKITHWMKLPKPPIV